MMADVRLSAIKAACGSLRRRGASVHMLAFDTTAEDLLEVLEDFSRLYHDSVIMQWYLSASDNQIRLFGRDFRRWQGEWKRLID